LEKVVNDFHFYSTPDDGKRNPFFLNRFCKKVRFLHKTVIDPPTMKEGLIKALKGVQMATGSGTDGLSRLHALIL
jgi:hypothetical protein